MPCEGSHRAGPVEDRRAGRLAGWHTQTNWEGSGSRARNFGLESGVVGWEYSSFSCWQASGTDRTTYRTGGSRTDRLAGWLTERLQAGRAEGGLAGWLVDFLSFSFCLLFLALHVTGRISCTGSLPFCCCCVDPLCFILSIVVFSIVGFRVHFFRSRSVFGTWWWILAYTSPLVLRLKSCLCTFSLYRGSVPTSWSARYTSCCGRHVSLPSFGRSCSFP